MENSTNNSALYSYFSQTLSFVSTLLSEFESVSGDKTIIRVLPSAEVVYMQIVILNLGKLLNATSRDKLGLKQFLNIGSEEHDKQIRSIQEAHKDLIEKIHTNRNRMFAHLDENFYSLCFSDDRISEMEQEIESGMGISKEEAKKVWEQLPRSTSKKQERYAPIDLQNDLCEVKEMLSKMDKIWKEVLLFDHLKTNETEINLYPKNVEEMINVPKFN